MNWVQRMIIWKEIIGIMRNLTLFALKIRLMGGHVDRMTGFLWREWLFSVFFLEERGNWEIEDYLKLPLIAGLATIRGLGGIENLEYKFKWTNDVYLENKKLCGILMEKTDDVYIVGIGINVNNILPEKLKNKAISLTQATDKKYEIDEIIKNIVPRSIFIGEFIEVILDSIVTFK